MNEDVVAVAVTQCERAFNIYKTGEYESLDMYWSIETWKIYQHYLFCSWIYMD